MEVTEDHVVLNSELEYIIKETRQKPMAVVVSLSFPPPAPFWLRRARAIVKNKPSNQKIIRRYDVGFWSGTDIQQQFVKVLNFARCRAEVIIGYGDDMYSTQVGKLLPLKHSRYGKLRVRPYALKVSIQVHDYLDV